MQPILLEAVFFITHPPRELTLEADWERVNSFFRRVLRFSRDYQIQILIENHPSGYWREGGNIKRIFDGFPSLKMNLDIGHLNRAVNEGMKMTASEFIDLPGDKIVYVHVHDSQGKIGDHFALGGGTAEKLVRLVKKLGIESWVIEAYDFQDALKTREVLMNKFGIK